MEQKLFVYGLLHKISKSLLLVSDYQSIVTNR